LGSPDRSVKPGRGAIHFEGRRIIHLKAGGIHQGAAVIKARGIHQGMSLDLDRGAFSDFLAALRSRVGAGGPASALVDENGAEEDEAPDASRVAPRRAAVALVLRGGTEGPELLVIKRSEAERDHWSGHLALPGGRAEPEDESLLATALRETFEEVGIDLRAGGEVLARLGTVKPQSPYVPRISVTPFVVAAPPRSCG
jgi:ADP-ribose pyrophosphatase YjhB (NUDIX family)